jgi:hypothetical protein
LQNDDFNSTRKIAERNVPKEPSDFDEPLYLCHICRDTGYESMPFRKHGLDYSGVVPCRNPACPKGKGVLLGKRYDEAKRRARQRRREKKAEETGMGPIFPEEGE